MPFSQKCPPGDRTQTIAERHHTFGKTIAEQGTKMPTTKAALTPITVADWSQLLVETSAQGHDLDTQEFTNFRETLVMLF